MSRMSAPAQIATSLSILSLAGMLLAHLVGVIPDARDAEVQHRIALCESVTVSLSRLATTGQLDEIATELDLLVKRNPSILSAGLRRGDGSLVVQAGDHATTWDVNEAENNDGHFQVPILKYNQPWGQVEIQFTQLYAGVFGYFSPEFFKCLLLLIPVVGITSFLQLKRVLKVLDPSRVVPDRVRDTIDNFAEGVLILDTDERIVLANKSFAKDSQVPVEQLVGKLASDISWVKQDEAKESKLPWQETCQHNRSVRGASLTLTSAETKNRIYTVNSVPIVDDGGKCRGALAAFTDVTSHEEKKAQLMAMTESLRASRDEISKQNKELRYIASHDSLTSCLNRRTFFERFEEEWQLAARNNYPLSCLMVDIDFFKSINDNYGHSMGDEVLRQTGTTLMKLSREVDLVCRYGGEEFCIVMPRLEIDDAWQAAERLRIALADLVFPDFSITASQGVSARSLGAGDVQQLLEEADKCLYVAKRNGRDQVVRWDEVPDDVETDEASISRTPTMTLEPTQPAIPFNAVTALISTLTYRDAETAAHCARVADLCVMLGRKHMSPREVYVLEVAALLHDIGKIGVSDAILLKPGELTEEEWEVMEMHDDFGVEILNASFRCPELSAIIQNHHARYEGDPERSDLPQGDDIPLGARILTIADAFDAMVSDRPYRKAVSIESAFRELRQCAGSQFDPTLVADFIELISSRDCIRTKKPQVASQETVLNIGQQVESILDALDSQDFPAFRSLIDRLRMTAEQANEVELMEIAESLSKEEPELIQLIEDMHELLEVYGTLHHNSIQQMKQGVGPREITNGALKADEPTAISSHHVK